MKKIALFFVTTIFMTNVFSMTTYNGKIISNPVLLKSVMLSPKQVTLSFPLNHYEFDCMISNEKKLFYARGILDLIKKDQSSNYFKYRLQLLPLGVTENPMFAPKEFGIEGKIKFNALNSYEAFIEGYAIKGKRGIKFNILPTQKMFVLEPLEQAIVMKIAKNTSVTIEVTNQYEKKST